MANTCVNYVAFYSEKTAKELLYPYMDNIRENKYGAKGVLNFGKIVAAFKDKYDAEKCDWFEENSEDHHLYDCVDVDLGEQNADFESKWAPPESIFRMMSYLFDCDVVADFGIHEMEVAGQYTCKPNGDIDEIDVSYWENYATPLDEDDDEDDEDEEEDKGECEVIVVDGCAPY